MTDSISDTGGTSEGERDENRARERHQRVAGLVDRLTLDEKIALVHGGVDPSGHATGYVPGVERLGIPPLSLVDGPTGVRSHVSTAFPSSLSLAATWDEDLAREFGSALAREVSDAGHDVVLAPGINIIRVPQCGRAFEYYSEDPQLTADVATAAIDGVQSVGVMATVKHFVANNQEVGRHEISAEVDERTLREIYLPAFEAAVRDAEVGAVMAAYNRINGTFATEHRRLLTEVLKDEWGFDGFVVSDWWATADGVAAAAAGLDLDMPGLPMYGWHVRDTPVDGLLSALPDSLPKRAIADALTKPWIPDADNPNLMLESPFDEPLRDAVVRGRIGESELDEKVARILGQMARFGLLDEGGPGGSGGTARSVGAVGSGGSAHSPDSGGSPGAAGSSGSAGSNGSSGLGGSTGSTGAAGGDESAGGLDAPEHHDLARRIAERGTVLLQNDGETLPLDEDASIAVIGPNATAAKVGGGGSSEVDPSRATDPLSGIRDRAAGDVDFARGVERVEEPEMVGGLFGRFASGDGDESEGEPSMDAALAMAERADVAVVFVRDAATETADRSLWLPGDQDRLVARVADVADRTVVVCNTGGAVRMPWAADVDAVVEAWYCGQADGLATASVLFGDADPSGRLPVTLGRRLDDYPTADERRYPGTGEEVFYDEGVFVGYRHFDAADIDPLYPFGHGESYADFEYGDVSVEHDGSPGATVEVSVENVADRAGREVVQVYLADPSASVERPPRELASFETVELDAGESRTVSCEVDERAFAFYDAEASVWAVEAGEFEVQVGRSSRDIRERETITVDEDVTLK